MRKEIIAIACCLLVALFCQRGEASEYPYAPPPKDGMGSASAVFAGILLDRTCRQEYPGISSNWDPCTWTFLVTQIWRGAPSDTIRVEARDIDVTPVIGERYLVHAREDKGKLQTNGRAIKVFEHALWYRYWLPEPLAMREDLALPRLTADALLDSLRNASAGPRDDAAYVLSHTEAYRDEGLKYFVGLIEKAGEDYPWSAYRAFSDVGPPARSVVPVLLRRWDAALKRERRDILTALGSILEPDEYQVHLARALSDPAFAIRAEACYQAGQIAGELSPESQQDLAQELVKAATDPVPKVRRAALLSLQSFEQDATYIIRELRPLAESETSSFVKVMMDSTITVLTTFVGESE